MTENESTMGFFGGSEEESNEAKTVDTTGNVNNNIVLLQEARDTHEQMILNQKLVYASYALVLFEVIKLAVYIFSSYKKKLKKTLSGNKA